MEIERIWRAGTELILGARCPGCGAAGIGVCASCRGGLQRTPQPVTGLPTSLPIWTGGAYEGELRRLMLAAKERRALAVVPVLAERLAAAVAAVVLDDVIAEQVVLVPVPSARTAVAERGVDLTATLARLACRRLRGAGLAVRMYPALRLVRRPEDQAGLSRAARLTNLTGAFAAAGSLPAGEYVVIDDIVTTGSTMMEAVRALSALGRPPVGAATVAATLRRRPG